jgi:hypothetical protein
VGFTPKTGVPAQCLNYYLNELFGRHETDRAAISGLLDYVGQMQVQNWPYLENGDKEDPHAWVLGDADWDPFHNNWASVAYDVTGNRVYTSFTGQTWGLLVAAFGAGGATRASVVVDRVTGNYYASSVGEISDFDWTTETWTDEATEASLVLSTGKWFNDRAVFVGGDGSDAIVGTYTTAEGWTKRVAPGTATATFDWASACSPSLMLAVPADGQDIAADLVGMTTTDGITWAATTLPTLADEAITDVCYGNGLFMLAVVDPVANTSKIYTSPDASTWTLKKSFSDRIVNAVANIGAMWFAAYGTDTSDSSSKGMFSLDNGATWGPADGFFGRLADNVRGRIASNGRQLLARVVTGFDAGAVGSLIAGLPAQE